MKNWHFSTGKKKRAIAKIFLKEDKSEILINNKIIKNYFPENFQYKPIFHPIELTKDNFKIIVKVKGGGLMSQIQAIKYGIAKAILSCNIKYKNILSQHKLLTTDSRRVERKKLGKKKARKSRQFSKR